MSTIYDQIWGKALAKVTLRPMSRHELRQKLLGDFPESKDDIERVLTEMERVNLMSDQRYAEMFLNHLTQKPVGRLKIKIETYRKGLPEGMVEQILLDMNWDELRSGRAALEEKEARVTEADPRRRKAKLINFLKNRGFTDATIYKLIREEE